MYCRGQDSWALLRSLTCPQRAHCVSLVAVNGFRIGIQARSHRENVRRSRMGYRIEHTGIGEPTKTFSTSTDSVLCAASPWRPHRVATSRCDEDRLGHHADDFIETCC